MRQPGKDSLRMLVNDTVDDSSRRSYLRDESAAMEANLHERKDFRHHSCEFTPTRDSIQVSK
jgi:hypothetical protein